MVEGITLNEFLENCGRFAEHLKKQEKAKKHDKKISARLTLFRRFCARKRRKRNHKNARSALQRKTFNRNEKIKHEHKANFTRNLS